MSKQNYEMLLFDFEDRNVRTLTLEGVTWFVGSDVGKILGYGNPAQAVRKYCKNIRKIGKDAISSVSQNANSTYGVVNSILIITESDLYRLIARSKLPDAERFEKWVFETVLPTIRKTGGYISPAIEATNEAIQKIQKESKENFDKRVASDIANIRLAKENAELREMLDSKITKMDIVNIIDNMVPKEDFNSFKDSVYTKLNKMEHDQKSPRVLRKELRDLVQRYGSKNNISDQYVWGELYIELNKEYKVFITAPEDGTKLDHVSSLGLLPQAIEMVQDWLEEEVVATEECVGSLL